MANILYVHGYGSDKNSTTGKYLKQILSPFHNVITNTYDLCNFDRAQHQIMTDAKRYRCAVVIGSSLGGFHVLSLGYKFRKVVINPCMLPSVEIPKIGTLTDLQKARFEEAEDNLYSNIDADDRLSTVGIFGKQDELFNYQQFFIKHYSAINFLTTNGKHRLNLRQLSDTIPVAIEMLPKVIGWDDGGMAPLMQHYINAPTTDEATKRQYMKIVYDILQKSYAYCGGMATVTRPEHLLEFDFWKLCRKNNRIVCVALYKTKYGGRKLCYAGTDGTEQGKDEFSKLLRDDIKLADRKMWSEVSDKMENKMRKEGAVPVPAEFVVKLFGPRKAKDIARIHKDGYHYDREFTTLDEDGNLKTEYHTKICFGNIEGIEVQ